MPEDCTTSATDCLPAGSNQNDPCSPCYEPSKESFLSDLANLARKVCALESSLKAKNQTIDKLRNRINRLEDTINNLPDPDEASDLINPCTNFDAAEQANGILVCDDGVQKLLEPSTEECSEILGKDGSWSVIPRGLRYYPLETAQTLATGAATVTSLNEYDTYVEYGCAIYAVLRMRGYVSGNSSTGGTFIWKANGIEASTMGLTNGGLDGFHSPFVVVPLTSESIAFTLTGSSVGSPVLSSNSFQLIGYLVG